MTENKGVQPEEEIVPDEDEWPKDESPYDADDVVQETEVYDPADEGDDD